MCGTPLKPRMIQKPAAMWTPADTTKETGELLLGGAAGENSEMVL